MLEWIYANEVIEKVEKDTTIDNWQDNFYYVMNYMLENKHFIIATYNSLSRRYLLDFLFKHYNSIFIDIIDKLSIKYNVKNEDKKFIANFYKYGFAGIIENWIINGMKEDPKKIINKLNIMISGSFEESLKKMST